MKYYMKNRKIVCIDSDENEEYIDKYVYILNQIQDKAEFLLEWAENHGYLMPEEVDKYEIAKANSILEKLKCAENRAMYNI